MKLEIREAGEDDAQSILNCLEVAFTPYRNQYTRNAFADTVVNLQMFQERMRHMHILVAVCEGAIVGTVSGAICEHGEGHLRGMAVLPQHKGTGIAAQLLNAMERWLQQHGCTRVTLGTTLPLRAAIKFYEKHGYVQSGRVSEFFGMPLLEYVKQLG